MRQKNYIHDKHFLEKHTTIYELCEGKSAVLIAPNYQARVMTSTYNKNRGSSFGWLNYHLIQSKKIQKQINAYGGEERFWLGPEGGQYSVYFKPNTSFTFKNWQVPSVIDTEAFQLIKKTKNKAFFEKEMVLVNYLKTSFKLLVHRNIEVLSKGKIEAKLNMNLQNIDFVAYKTVNKITNKSKEAWSSEKGLLNIWILGMFQPSEDAKIIIPIKDKQHIVCDYFGKISNERLKITNHSVVLKADGKSRGKIGIPPESSSGYAASYSEDKGELTIVCYQKMKENKMYLNSKWELQKNPFTGDVINAYNDGKLENGQQLGPFYELETSSPTAFLQPNEFLEHIQYTFHFKGSKSILSKLGTQILNINL